MDGVASGPQVVQCWTHRKHKAAPSAMGTRNLPQPTRSMVVNRLRCRPEAVGQQSASMFSSHPERGVMRHRKG